LTLAVCDQTAVASEVLAGARRHVVRIFSDANVDVTWLTLDRRSQCALPGGNGRRFIVVILPKAPSGWASPEAMGFAPTSAGPYPRGYVFYNFVQYSVDALERHYLRTWALGTMLGHAIAHELGHLLIPGDAHSPQGIMTAHWTYLQWEYMAAGQLLFDDRQAAAMRRNLERR
jgi:hypothetical protein